VSSDTAIVTAKLITMVDAARPATCASSSETIDRRSPMTLLDRLLKHCREFVQREILNYMESPPAGEVAYAVGAGR
jgi:hypothetical protein